jgi:hypothetical protein
VISSSNTFRIDEMIKQRMDFQKNCHLENLEKAKAQLRDCTFKPKINTKKVEKGRGVHEKLYLMAERKMGRIDRSSEEVEFEKAKEECTFTPAGVYKNTVFKFTSPQSQKAIDD